MRPGNSWPTRWAMVIREKTRAGQEVGLRPCDREALLVAGRGERMLAELLGGPPAGWPPEIRPHPEQAKASASTQPIKALATWCLAKPPDFLQVTLPISHIITSGPVGESAGPVSAGSPRPAP